MEGNNSVWWSGNICSDSPSYSVVYKRVAPPTAGQGVLINEVFAPDTGVVTDPRTELIRNWIIIMSEATVACRVLICVRSYVAGLKGRALACWGCFDLIIYRASKVCAGLRFVSFRDCNHTQLIPGNLEAQTTEIQKLPNFNPNFLCTLKRQFTYRKCVLLRISASFIWM